MSEAALTDFEREASLCLVTLAYVAKYYGVSRMSVWNAAADGRLSAIWVRTSMKAHARNARTVLFDIRLLPRKFPHS